MLNIYTSKKRKSEFMWEINHNNLKVETESILI
jgi:hypothetical protein